MYGPSNSTWGIWASMVHTNKYYLNLSEQGVTAVVVFVVMTNPGCTRHVGTGMHSDYTRVSDPNIPEDGTLCYALHVLMGMHVYYFKYTCMGSFVLKRAQLRLAFSVFYHFSNLRHKLQTQLPTV